MGAFNRPPIAKLKWIGVDLDNTLAHGVWTEDNPDTGIGEPMYDNLLKLKWLLRRHPSYKIVIYTARGWEFFHVVEAWLDYHAIPYNRIECGKLLLHRMIDDKAIPADHPDWSAAV